ncbi:MAG: ketoacyl-ACP synthase III, partial [Acidobacteria bacterium]|nr:ketoacyl-ACP synthase III [Acidobacteriota bacterium]
MTDLSLTGFAHALPERIVTNAELAAEFAVEASWIRDVSGIEERRYAADGDTPATLAHRAALLSLERAGLSPKDLGAIVVGSGSGPRRFPGISASLQKLLGAPGIPALDVPLASVGGLFALALAADLAPRYGPVLVVGSEVMSRVLAIPPRVKETAILFGDGAGSCIVLPSSGPHTLVDARMASDGTYEDDLALPLDGALAMNGRQVILQANRKLQAATTDLVSRSGLTLDDIGLFVFHQANSNLLRQVA